jgi:hypothetical protein
MPDPQPELNTIQQLQKYSPDSIIEPAGEIAFRKTEPQWGARQIPDEIIGYLNKPLSNVTDCTWTWGKLNPIAHYTIDSLGRRITGLNTISTSTKKYALFFGCSIGFGLHVDNDQTLPAFFEGMDTSWKAYNYSVSGFGPHNILALFENRNLRSEIVEKDGVAFYIFFIGHVERAIGDMKSYLNWNATSPYYFLDDGQLKRKGNFKNGRKIISSIYDFISKTYFGKFFNIHLPFRLTSYHYELTVRIIKEISNKYKEQFKNDNFNVVLVPGFDHEEISHHFKNSGLKIIDCSSLVNNYWDGKYQFEGDGHPRPLFYNILAKHLHATLKNN